MNNDTVSTITGGNGSITLSNINHNKLKKLVIPAGLALYDYVDHTHKHKYDIIHKNETVHNSLYDRLLELASYNNDDDTKKDKKEKKEKKDNKENIKLKIHPVLNGSAHAAAAEPIKSKKTKKRELKGNSKQTRRRKISKV